MNAFRTFQSTFFFVAAAAGLVCGNAAFADVYDPPVRVVKFDDLNLDKQAGIASLYKRIASAAKVVCAPTISVPMTLRSNSRVCERATIADAVSRINNANLTAYSSMKGTTATEGNTKVAASD